MNFVTALYHVQGISLPVGVTLIAKTENYIGKKDGKTKRCSPIGKNEYFRTMVHQAVATQTNHFFGALCGYIKLEMLKQQTKLNHFALRAKLYTRALRVAFDALAEFQPVRLAA